jgi:hypothetical protein
MVNRYFLDNSAAPENTLLTLKLVAGTGFEPVTFGL